MVVMHAVAIYYLDGQEFYVGYVTQEIRKQQQEQQIYVMIVGIDFHFHILDISYIFLLFFSNYIYILQKNQLSLYRLIKN